MAGNTGAGKGASGSRYDRLAIGQVENTAARTEHRGHLPGGAGERCDRFERRNSEKRKSRDEHTVERSLRVRGHRGCEHSREGQAGDEDRKRVRETGGQRVAPAEPRELAVGRANGVELLRLLAVHDQLRCAAQKLHELRGELAACCGLTATRRAPEERGDGRNGDPAGKESHHEYRSGDGKEDRGRDDTRHGDDESDQGRSDSSQIEALKRVHVADHSADQVTAPESLELRRGEGLDSRVEALADPAETPQREIVRRQPLEVAGERTRQPEEPDDDDRDGEREDGRLLRGA